MLVLSRKINESVYIGNHISIRVVRIKGNVVGLGIEAPNNVRIMRSELLQTERELQEAKQKPKQSVANLSNFTIAG